MGIWPGDALAQPSPVERPHLPGFPPPRERRVVASQPNIVFLFPDQLRRDFLSCYGAGFIQTPHSLSPSDDFGREGWDWRYPADASQAALVGDDYY